MKIVLIHCYSDNNKGDLGIILATIKLLRDAAPSATIAAVSTFEEEDPFFQSEHLMLREHVDMIYPALVGRVFAPHGDKLTLFFKTLRDLPKLCSLFLPKWFPFRSALWGEAGRQVAAELETADLVISKGGSFLCCLPSFISKLRLIRLLSILRLSQSLNKNVVLWGQSIGPIYGVFTKKLVNSCLAAASMIVLREEACKEMYRKLCFPERTTAIGCDLAFSLDSSDAPPSGIFEEGQQYIGFTVKRFSAGKTDAQYTLAIVNAITSCVRIHGRTVIIVPHVTIDDDLEKAREIFCALDDETAERVAVLEGHYSIGQLVGIYNRFELLVGTRLHSTIFAMCAGTPAINIAYHGTKSQGVFSQLGLNDLVIESSELESDRLTQLIASAITSEDLVAQLGRQVAIARDVNRDMARRLIDHASTRQI